MKKILLVSILVLVIAGAAFADHPSDKFGIGLMGGYYGGWEGGGWGHTALSLKLPNIPIYWAINLGFDESYFRMGLSGDYYLVEGVLVSDINLHWFAGLGAWANLGFFSNDAYISFGGRLPIGLSWHVIEILEIFLDVAPSLGVQVTPKFYFPSGGWPIEIGIRIWL